MDDLTPVSIKQMHQWLRERVRGWQTSFWNVSRACEQSGPHSPIEMLEKLHEKQKRRQDQGIVNLLKSWFLAPASPFDPERRRLPRREVVAVGCLVALLLGAILWFNVVNLS